MANFIFLTIAIAAALIWIFTGHFFSAIIIIGCALYYIGSRLAQKYQKH